MSRLVWFVIFAMIAVACGIVGEEFAPPVPTPVQSAEGMTSAAHFTAHNPLGIQPVRPLSRVRNLTEDSPVPIPTPSPSDYPTNFVDIDGEFEIMDTHVTVEQWKLASDVGAVPPSAIWPEVEWSSIASTPVVYVTAEWMMQYATWLSDGSTEYKYSLPTMAQWDRIAGDALYPFGDDPAVLADININHPNDGVVEPVKNRPADTSPYGIRDMCGNVFDVTSTRDEYGNLHIRGGAAWHDESYCRVAYTDVVPAQNGYSGGMGFRLVRVRNPEIELPPMTEETPAP